MDSRGYHTEWRSCLPRRTKSSSWSETGWGRTKAKVFRSPNPGKEARCSAAWGDAVWPESGRPSDELLRRCAQNDILDRTGRIRSCGKCDKARSCIWDALPSSWVRGIRARIDICRRIYTSRFLRMVYRVRFCIYSSLLFEALGWSSPARFEIDPVSCADFDFVYFLKREANSPRSWLKKLWWYLNCSSSDSGKRGWRGCRWLASPPTCEILAGKYHCSIWAIFAVAATAAAAAETCRFAEETLTENCSFVERHCCWNWFDSEKRKKISDVTLLPQTHHQVILTAPRRWLSLWNGKFWVSDESKRSSIAQWNLTRAFCPSLRS